MSRMQECSQVIQSTVEVLLRQITNALLLYNGILYSGLDRSMGDINTNKHYSDDAVRGGGREGEG